MAQDSIQQFHLRPFLDLSEDSRRRFGAVFGVFAISESVWMAFLWVHSPEMEQGRVCPFGELADKSWGESELVI